MTTQSCTLTAAMLECCCWCMVHGWQLPAELAERPEAAEKRRLALHWAARQQGQKMGSMAGLGPLLHELLKKIAWEADIDFSWSLSDSEET